MINGTTEIVLVRNINGLRNVIFRKGVFFDQISQGRVGVIEQLKVEGAAGSHGTGITVHLEHQIERRPCSPSPAVVHPYPAAFPICIAVEQYLAIVFGLGACYEWQRGDAAGEGAEEESGEEEAVA